MRFRYKSSLGTLQSSKSNDIYIKIKYPVPQWSWYFEKKKEKEIMSLKTPLLLMPALSSSGSLVAFFPTTCTQHSITLSCSLYIPFLDHIIDVYQSPFLYFVLLTFSWSDQQNYILTKFFPIHFTPVMQGLVEPFKYHLAIHLISLTNTYTSKLLALILYTFPCKNQWTHATHIVL